MYGHALPLGLPPLGCLHACLAAGPCVLPRATVRAAACLAWGKVGIHAGSCTCPGLVWCLGSTACCAQVAGCLKNAAVVWWGVVAHGEHVSPGQVRISTAGTAVGAVPSTEAAGLVLCLYVAHARCTESAFRSGSRELIRQGVSGKLHWCPLPDYSSPLLTMATGGRLPGQCRGVCAVQQGQGKQRQ